MMDSAYEPGRGSSSGVGDQDSVYAPSTTAEASPLKSQYHQSVMNTVNKNASQGQIVADPQDDYMQNKRHHHIDRRIVLACMMFSILTVAIQMCAIVVPHWWVTHSYSQGLWMRCSYYAQWMNCVDTDFEVTDFLNAARALEIIAGIIYGFAMLCGILHLTNYHRSFWIKVGLAGGIAVGGLFAFVGAVAFIGKVKETNAQSVPGASFILAIINAGISWAFSLAACLNFRRF